jgi:histidinol-phosphate aminotransferase
MSAVEALLRPDLRGFGGYASAGMRAFVPRIRLDANESPWPNPADGASGLRCYPEPQPPALLAALARLHGVASERVLACRGSDEGIDLLLRASCEPGAGSVVVAPPVFGMYAVCARLHGVRVVEVPLHDTGTAFRPDLDAIAQATLDSQARLVFLCSPGNPTGEALAPAVIAALAQRLRDAALVVVDEAYAEFSDVPSAVTQLQGCDNLVVLRTLSKAHALAGARVGCLLAAPALVRALRRCQAPYPLPVPSVAAALSALAPGAVARTRRRCHRLALARERLAARLESLPGVRRVYPSQGNFLLLRLQAPDAALARLQARGIAVRDMRCMPQLGDALRVTVGNAAQNAALLAALVARGDA